MIGKVFFLGKERYPFHLKNIYLGLIQSPRIWIIFLGVVLI